MALLLRSPLGACLLLVSAMTGVISVGYPLALNSAGFAKADIALFFVINSVIAFTLALSSSRPAALRHAYRLLVPALLIGALGVTLVCTGHSLPLVSLGGALSMAAAVSLPLILRQLQTSPAAAELSDSVLAARTRWIAVAGYITGVAGFAGSSSLTAWWPGWIPVGAAVPLLAGAAVLAAVSKRAVTAATLAGATAGRTSVGRPPEDVAGRLGARPALLLGVAAIVLLKAADSLRLVYLPLFVIASGWDERLNSLLFMATALVELAILPWLGRSGERHPAARLLALAALGGAVSFALTAAWASFGSLLASQVIYAVFAAALQSLGMVVLAGLMRGGLPAGAGLFAGVMQLGSLVGILAPLTVSGYRPALFWIAVVFCAVSAIVLTLLSRLTSPSAPSLPGEVPMTMSSTKLPADARRRLHDEPQTTLTPDLLVQPVDVDLALSEGGRSPVEGLPGWHSHGVTAAVDRIREGHRHGIGEFVLRISDTSTDSRQRSLSAQLDRHASAVSHLVREAPPGIRCTVDPFALALNPDGTWGLRDDTDGLDVPATYALLRDTAAAVAEAGAHGIVTLGRLPLEVTHTRAGITSVKGRTRLYSFSQNSETSTAYVYLDEDHRDTGQKILPGNLTEMTLWSLLDAFQGTEVSVTKPLENFHATLDLARHIQHEELVDRLLSSLDPTVSGLPPLSGDTARLVAELLDSPQTVMKSLEQLELYGYTVSGTTRALSVLAAADGLRLARARLEESWHNWLAAAGPQGGRIIDRNAISYLQGGLLGAVP
ncbi:hypothetical protein LHJ74_27895 [Streptomyces sp. N2-109]|uniref:Delta-aminolevulinic acid dehydratase n=1 Tax=Streptomyces gossypii TaxID=2883101 RepID=A0ABT2JYH5_9ACTN|nr:MFS transporter [Streptomyces gossypii]MCT2592950.1 hypothetical protein [Streptomyces gossypii]MCT2593683.1 hypothetical protein [Streptomyces gossypii]